MWDLFGFGAEDTMVYMGYKDFRHMMEYYRTIRSEVTQPKEEITKPMKENKPVPTEEANIRNIKIEHRRPKYSENG